MSVIVIFMLGIVNFAMHRAVMESGHPILGEAPWLAHQRGRRFALFTEFLVLVAALSLARMGYPTAAWVYAGYSAFNGVAAWLILSRRM